MQRVGYPNLGHRPIVTHTACYSDSEKRGGLQYVTVYYVLSPYRTLYVLYRESVATTKGKDSCMLKRQQQCYGMYRSMNKSSKHGIVISFQGMTEDTLIYGYWPLETTGLHDSPGFISL